MNYVNNWGLSPGKYLLINYDEKWFWEIVIIRSAKACASIVTDPVSYKAYHSRLINTVICITITGISFIYSLDNGGKSVKLGNYITQPYKIAQRKVYKTEGQVEGSIRRFTKRIFYHMGQQRRLMILKERKATRTWLILHLLGLVKGRLMIPIFHWKLFFQYKIFPEIADLVYQGGQYDGYTPVIQGDNTGPHEERHCIQFVKNNCE